MLTAGYSRGAIMDEIGFFVSQNLHHYSIRNIFYAPMSFFDTTVRRTSIYNQCFILTFIQPMGRILSVFGKDIESMCFNGSKSDVITHPKS